MPNWWDQIRLFNGDSFPKSTQEIDDWLSEPSGKLCACGQKLLRWEAYNGRCQDCMEASYPADAPTMGGCSCSGVPASNYGYHFTEEGSIYERCPHYWAKAGFRTTLETREEPQHRWRKRLGRFRLTKETERLEA